jgi:hypothetical protein
VMHQWRVRSYREAVYGKPRTERLDVDMRRRRLEQMAAAAEAAKNAPDAQAARAAARAREDARLRAKLYGQPNARRVDSASPAALAAELGMSIPDMRPTSPAAVAAAPSPSPAPIANANADGPAAAAAADSDVKTADAAAPSPSPAPGAESAAAGAPAAAAAAAKAKSSAADSAAAAAPAKKKKFTRPGEAPSGGFRPHWGGDTRPVNGARRFGQDRCGPKGNALTQRSRQGREGSGRRMAN